MIEDQEDGSSRPFTFSGVNITFLDLVDCGVRKGMICLLIEDLKDGSSKLFTFSGVNISL